MRNFLRTAVTFAALGMLVIGQTGCSPQARKDAHLKKAGEFFAQGKYDQAEIEYLNVLKIEALNAVSIGRLGLIYAEQGRLSQAVAYLGKGRELDPTNLDLRFKIGQLNLATGNVKEARSEANYILDRRPTDPAAPLLLVETITKPEEIDAIRLRLQGLPAPANGGAPILVAMGLIEFRLRHFKEAETLLQQAQTSDAKFAATYSALGALYLALKNPPAAEQAFKQAAETSSLRSPRRLQYAQYKIQTGDLVAGKHLLGEMTREAPDFLPAWTTLAEIALTEKNFAECTRFNNKVLARDPTNLQALLGSGRVRLTQGEYDQAIEVLEKLASLYPKFPTVYFELGRCHAATGELGKAVERLNQAINLAPGYADAVVLLAGLNIRKGDASGAIVLLRKLAQQRPDLPQARLLLADAYRAKGNLDDALAIYRQVEEQFPENRQTPYLRGMVLMQQNKRAEARSALERAHELSPDNPMALEQLVNLDLVERRFQPARDRVEAESVRHVKLAGFGQLLLAKIFLAQEDKTQAEIALKKAIELMPDAPTAYFLLARIYASTNQREKALASLKQALTRNPKDTTTLMLIGAIHDQQKEYPAAREAYEKALAINPKFSGALNNLAYLYSEKLNDLNKAYELAQRARELQPNEPHVADTLGWILFNRRQYPRALILLQESAERLPSVADVQYHLGMTHYMMGEEQSARLALQRAMQTGADFEGFSDARTALRMLDADVGQMGPELRTNFETEIANRKNDPIALARLASIFEREGNVDRAIASLESALQSNTGNVNVLIRLAGLYAKKKDTLRALDLAKTARKLSPGDMLVAHILGRIAYEMGDHEWAASLLQEAAGKGAPTQDLQLDLAQALYSVGRVADAEMALRDVLAHGESFKRTEEATNLLTLIELTANPTEATSQTAHIEKVLASDPNNVPALMVFGTINEAKSDFAAARQVYRRALVQYPAFALAKLRLAILGATEKEFNQESYDRALQARTAYPNSFELSKALGILTYRKGDYARAVNLMKGSLTVRDSDAELWYYLGMAQFKTKDAVASRRALQKSMELGLHSDLAAIARKTLESLK